MRNVIATSCAVVLVGVLAAAAAGAPAGPPAARPARSDALPDATVVSFAAAGAAKSGSADLHRLVALPPGATRASAEILSGAAGSVRLDGGIRVLRGVPVVSLVVEDPSAEKLEIAVRHDGDWTSATTSGASRLACRTFASALGDALPAAWRAAADASPGGSYVIVTAPAFRAAAETMADWKRRRGLPTVVADTDEIGTTNTAIFDWLENAYLTWERPPEYVLLLGDIDRIPAWSLVQNLSDQKYGCLDGDDWLPDILVGRLSVETELEARTAVAKSIAYERTPPLTDPGWFTRSLMVAANYPAASPVGTVLWCGEQLESIGFDPAAEVLFDEASGHIDYDGVVPITAALDAGVGIVAYRGWARGIYGWEIPRFETIHIPGVHNAGMTPIVLSFVCDTGNFAADEACMGEVFVRHGTPTNPEGAVAFFGNTEYWSHTVFNDALAISCFERFTDPAITELGAWILAGKLRFMDYFPLELDSEVSGEESVEFYFYIYNLQGDPGLAVWKHAPTPLDVTHRAQLHPGADLLEVDVRDAGSGPLADALVGVVQDGTLLGSARTAADGAAWVPLAGLATGSPVAVTVSHPDRLADESTISVGAGTRAHVAAVAAAVDDDAAPPSSGDGDAIANPAETVEIAVTVRNTGGASAGAGTAVLDLRGPATVLTGEVALPALAPGAEAVLPPFLLAVDDDAEDGAVLACRVAALHDDSPDTSLVSLAVAAPAPAIAGASVAGDGVLDPGETAGIVLSVRNDGAAAFAGGTLTLSSGAPDAAVLLDAEEAIGPLAPGASTTLVADAFSIRAESGTAPGTGIPLLATLVSDAGCRRTCTTALTVGRVDAGVPVGPDAHGYYAYDSADLDFPDQAPTYAWREISPTFGGAGTALEFLADNHAVIMDIGFDFVYYGQTFSRVRISENGYVCFDTDVPPDWDNFPIYDFYNWPLPSTYGPHSIVAPFWDNFKPFLVPGNRPEPDGVYWLLDADAGTFTVEWSRVSHYSPEVNDLQTIQVVLLDPAVHPTGTGDGDILFLYKQVHNRDHTRMFATVGWESPDETDGVELSYGNVAAAGMAPLGGGLAVRITTEPPVYAPYTLSSFTAAPAAAGLALAWTPADDRPVVGWLLDRVAGPDRVRLTASPLPPERRTFLDADAPDDGGAGYVLTALHPYGRRTELGPLVPEGAAITRAALLPASPNPTRGSTRLGFALPRSGRARLRIYDLAGRCVRTLVDGPVDGGVRRFEWDGRDGRGRPAAGGIYLYRLEAGGEVLTRKLILVR